MPPCLAAWRPDRDYRFSLVTLSDGVENDLRPLYDRVSCDSSVPGLAVVTIRHLMVSRDQNTVFEGITVTSHLRSTGLVYKTGWAPLIADQSLSQWFVVRGHYAQSSVSLETDKFDLDALQDVLLALEMFVETMLISLVPKTVIWQSGWQALPVSDNSWLAKGLI